LTVGLYEGSPSSNETALEVVAGLLIDSRWPTSANPKHLSRLPVVHQHQSVEAEAQSNFEELKKIPCL
jgi:hypothetical protein